MGDVPAPQIVRLLAALADGNRFRIVELLSKESAALSCGAICNALDLSPSLISHHLGILESAGVVERRKDGLWTRNRLRREELERRLGALDRILGRGAPELPVAD